MNKSTSLSGKELVDAAIESLQQKLAENIVVIDLKEVSGTTDYFIICEADNTAHTSAIGQGLIKNLKEQNTKPWHQEGLDDGRWVLVDYTDVVVHVMLPDVRSYYDLESLWNEGTITTIPNANQ